MTIDQLASSLEDRLGTLVGGYRTDMPRQRTLRATIDWSYELLTDDERRVLRALSVFRGGATIRGIEDVCGAGAAMVLSGLIDRSLVIVGEERYHLLETIAEYAAEKLVDAGEDEDVRERHRDHLIATSDPTDIKGLALELDNHRAALAFRRDRKMLELVSRVGHVWFRQGPYDEGRRWLREALEADQEPSATRANVLLQLSGLVTSMGLLDEGARAVDEALEWHRAHGPGEELAYALIARADTALMQTDFSTARRLLDEALAIDVDDSTDIAARCSYSLSQIALIEGRFDDAVVQAGRAAEAFAGISDHHAATATLQLARAEQAAGRTDDARRHFAEVMQVHGAGGDRSSVAFAAWMLGTLEVSANNVELGLRHLEDAHRIGEEIADVAAPLVLTHIGHAKYLLGRKDEGRSDVDRSLEILERTEHPYGIPYARVLRSDVALLDDELDVALDHAKEGLRGFVQFGDRGGAASAVLRIATIRSQQGEHGVAAPLFAAAETLLGPALEAEAFPGFPLDAAIERTRNALGAEAFERAWIAGSKPDLDTAVELALS